MFIILQKEKRSDIQLNRYLKKQISVRNLFQVVRSILLDKLSHRRTFTSIVKTAENNFHFCLAQECLQVQ